MGVQVNVSWRDQSNEVAGFTFYQPSVAADGSNWAAITADISTIIAALNAVTLGNLFQQRVVASTTKYTNAIPTTGNRELKVLVRYQDDVTLKVHSFEIPMPDESKFPFVAGSDFVDINDTSIVEFTTLLAAINSDFLSPAGNAVTVISMERVGRNL